MGDLQIRLITLVGPGGIGKSRLAIEAARSQIGKNTHGVAFIPLAGVNSPSLVIPAIADGLGFVFHGTTAPKAQLINYLREKQVLLIMDTFEHLIAGAGLVGEILRYAPQMKALCTSREQLNLQGEWVFEVRGLNVPESEHVEGIEGYSAIALFLECARRTRTGFKLRPESRLSIVRICQMVQGVPLAIELAAAWVRVLSLQEIVQEVERNLDFLESFAHDIPERHRSIRATFDHSWNLLSENERNALARLSVFRSGFTRDAAGQIAGITLPLLSLLTAKSLVHRNTAGCFNLHELIRSYAAEKLQFDPKQELRTRECFCDYYASLMEGLKEEFECTKGINALAEMGDEIDNLRQAWDWMVSLGQSANISRSQFSLYWFHELRGWYPEGKKLFEQAATALRESIEKNTNEPEISESLTALGQVLTRQARMLACSGELETAYELLEESQALLRASSDQVTLGDALRLFGNIEFVNGNFGRAKEILQESIAVNRKANNQRELASSLSILGNILLFQGEYDQSYQVSLEGVVVARAVGEPRILASSLFYQADVAQSLGLIDEAEQLLKESLAISKSINDLWSMASALRVLGAMALTKKEASNAANLFRSSIELFQQIGMTASASNALNDLGETLLPQDSLEEAKPCYLEALQISVEMHMLPTALEALTGIANIRMREKAFEPAFELATYAVNHPANYPSMKDRAEQLCTDLELHLTPQQIEKIQARMQAKTLEDIVNGVLDI